MRSISWMTFILVVAFAMYLRSIESFSSANRDQLSMIEQKHINIHRNLSSVEDKKIEDLKNLKNALEPQPSIQDFQ